MKRHVSFAIILILMGASCLISWNFYFQNYVHGDTANIHTFPKKIGDWVSDELAISSEDYAILETKNAFSRRYQAPDGREVFLFAVYSQHNRKVSYPPEISYTGSGISVVNKKQEQLLSPPGNDHIDANKLLVEYGKNQQVMYYWFKVGDSYTTSYWKQQMLIAVKSFLGEDVSSAMIRISSIVHDGDVVGAEKDIRDFSYKIIPQLRSYLP